MIFAVCAIGHRSAQSPRSRGPAQGTGPSCGVILPGGRPDAGRQPAIARLTCRAEGRFYAISKEAPGDDNITTQNTLGTGARCG